MAKNQGKYYKSKKDESCLIHTNEGETLVDENNEWQEISATEYNALSQIKELKKEIAQTDYIACKLAEAETEQEKAELRQTYATQLSRRVEIRAQINELEEDL